MSNVLNIIVVTYILFFIILRYAGQNFTIVFKSSSNFSGGFSGLAHKQPLASVCRSSCRYQLYSKQNYTFS